MVFTARCVCTKHSTWSHGNVSPDALRVADPEELTFCEVDSSKNKDRKRKICLACCGRLKTFTLLQLPCFVFSCSTHLCRSISLYLIFSHTIIFSFIYFICLLFRINKPVSTRRKICAMYLLSAKVKLTTPNIHQAVYLRLPAPNMCKFWKCLYNRTRTQKIGLSKLWGQRPSRLLKNVLTNLCITTQKTYLNL